MDKYVQAARLRIREFDANLKMTKRELRRARKTIKTYEMLAVLNEGKPKAAERDVAPPAPVAPAVPPAPKVDAVAAAMEALLRREMMVLAERLSRATAEAQQLRGERDEMYTAIKDIEATVKAKGKGRTAPPWSMRSRRQTCMPTRTCMPLAHTLSPEAAGDGAGWACVL
jgi:zinc finger protein DZIP1